MTVVHSRRDFLALLGASTLGVLGCGSSSGVDDPRGGGVARLTARPGTPTASVTPGSLPITPSNPNDGVLVVPSSYDPVHPVPIVVALHGAGQGPQFSVGLLGPYAQQHGFLLLAVGSRGLTWDVISYKFSYDVLFMDQALQWAFERCAVDPARVFLAGFSDGASYALGIALANGDLFSRVIAFSPGFIPRSDSAPVGTPRFFDSHGRQDTILHIDNASRKIVPLLQGRGYDVTYVEFDGGHEVPPFVAADAMTWMLG